ncbi:unnamed protein product [Mytilus coruscus]|uniref:Uncharacterized protein n=1 Tax=Mytilus coruscus TaxID=42192 RepID=A0A6J8C4I4_MYTCO|nr:unnamed protein product [Mytilus coruscus]
MVRDVAVIDKPFELVCFIPRTLKCQQMSWIAGTKDDYQHDQLIGRGISSHNANFSFYSMEEGNLLKYFLKIHKFKSFILNNWFRCECDNISVTKLFTDIEEKFIVEFHRSSIGIPLYYHWEIWSGFSLDIHCFPLEYQLNIQWDSFEYSSGKQWKFHWNTSENFVGIPLFSHWTFIVFNWDTSGNSIGNCNNQPKKTSDISMEIDNSTEMLDIILHALLIFK